MRSPIQISSRLHKYIKKEAKKGNTTIQEKVEEYIRNDITSIANAENNREQSMQIIPDGEYKKSFYFWENFRNYIDFDTMEEYAELDNNPIKLAENYKYGIKMYIEDAKILSLNMMIAKKMSETKTIEEENDRETYIVKTGEQNIYKIGESGNTEQRVKNINGEHLFTFSSKHLEQYILRFYSNRIIYLSDDNTVETENIYLLKEDILNIYIGLKKYIKYTNQELLNSIIYTKNGFFNNKLEQTIKDIYIPAQESENAKKFAYNNIASLVNIKVLGCSGTKYAKDNNVEVEEGKSVRDYLSKEQLEAIKEVERRVSGLIEFASITDYEKLREII